ncbi:hypothetical protein FSP39_004959 [Pinctada imbricata]|uniref:Uncharacterized protein n=1 Tax=Pinctada imbricata TaxID=66713 RepID=A0AA89C0J3_PINIB|nr:hypothetical protein FSP39_004959 [Pinctada imbricata]
MKVKTKDGKAKISEERNKGNLRRSQRLKQISPPLSSAKGSKAKSKKLSKVSSQTVLREKQPTSASAKSKSRPSASCRAEKQRKGPTPKMECKSKPKSSQKVEIDYRRVPTDPEGYVPVQKTIRNLTLPLLKTIQIEDNYYGDVSAINFSDVAFLDESHILALDDNNLKLDRGHRVCCVNVDGTLVCDLLVPGYPWSIVVLSPTEAVATVRRLESDGLIWISIDVHAKSIEITKHLPLDQEPFGLSYDDRSDLFIVSYFHQRFMSVLSRNGDEIRKIGLRLGAHFRCLTLTNSRVLYLDTQRHTVNAIDQKGKAKMLIKHASFNIPICLETDCLQNMYVGNFGSGQILKFDQCGTYRATFQCGSNLNGIGIDRKSERIVVAQNNSLLIYELDNNA